jgi:crotonobetainyl-CoA:carnitine CoA-transferase CaiB-like acyl-CoA transferase
LEDGLTDQPVLQNIRILDFTWVLAGPYATRLLADFGAEVIKIQPPLSSEGGDGFDRGYYNTWNRNKLGITLNLKKPEGLAVARRLVAVSDAVVENFTPRVMANWGLDYDNLKTVRPELIMLSMSAMGGSGPWRDYTGFGPTVQAFSGLTYLTSFLGEPPLGLGFSYADHVAGLFAALALLGALEQRRRTGEGQHVDISQVEAMAALLGGVIYDYTKWGIEPLPEGNSSSVAAPHNVYRCCGDDRWCAIAVFTGEEWQNFKRALGNPSWADDNKFATVESRFKNRDELDMLISEWTEEHTAEEVMYLLQRQGVASGVVQNAGDLAGSPQLKERGFFVELGHPALGKMISDAVPMKFSSAAAEYNRAAPVEGQDNDYVYRQLLGMSEKELADLREKGVI